MTKSDCVIGQYYSWYERKQDIKPYCIIQYAGDINGQTIYGPRLSNRLEAYCIKEGLSVSERDVRIATPAEIAWLDACILAGKWVENPKLKDLPIFN